MSEHVNTCFTWPRKTLSWLKCWEKMTCNNPVKLEEPMQLWLKWRDIGYLSLRGILTYVKEETKCDQGVFMASKSDVALLLYQARICSFLLHQFQWLNGGLVFCRTFSKLTSCAGAELHVFILLTKNDKICQNNKSSISIESSLCVEHRYEQNKARWKKLQRLF